MLSVIHSNWTEALLAALAERLPRDPFVETTIVVPNRAMERAVEVGVARSRGMVVNVRFERLERWVEREVAGSAGASFLTARALEGRLLAVLSDPSLAALAGTDEPLGAVARYLLAAEAPWSSASCDRRRLELASRLAHLYAEYALTRPDWIRAWSSGEGAAPPDGPTGPTEAWQRALYRRARFGTARFGTPSLEARTPGPEAAVTLAEALGLPEPDHAPGADGPVFVIGVSYVAPVFHHALARIARRRDVTLLVSNPCREFWADAVKGARAGEPASESESAVLLAWGRPGREHVARLDEAVGFGASTRFVDPTARFRARGVPAPMLQRVQRSLLERAPVEPGPTDGSLVVLPCPGARREVETVAQLVWGLVAVSDRRARAAGAGLGGAGLDAGEREGEEPLRLPDIAILVSASERDRYLPHLEAVLGDGSEPEHLPWSAQDLSLAARSRVTEAALRLVAFLDASPTRRELLGLVAHPLVRPASLADEGTTEREWAELAERAGIVRGIDEADLAGTYAAAEGGGAQALHFDQGLRRLALGCASGGRARQDAEAEQDTDDERLEAVAVGARTEATMTLVTLARSLLADHRAVGGARLSPGAWGLLLEALVGGYVRAESAAEERELERSRAALRGLAALDAPMASGSEEPARIASGLALPLARRALEELSAIRGAPQSTGLVVASLLPMRAIPFRVVFVLGMGERLFPSERTEPGLDLRTTPGAARRAGDVAPDERDRYAFLEVLSSTRERLFLSYVARDEHTGDALGPSSVITELCEASGQLLEARPPRRRDESLGFEWTEGLGLDDPTTRAAMAAALPAALAERSARARGDAERHHFVDVEVASEAWARLAADEARRAELVLAAPMPGARSAQDGAATLVRLHALRRFLACPIQGRGTQWLGAEEDERTLLVAEEPLEAERATLERVARDALARALEEGLGAREERAAGTLERALRAVLREEQRCARVPVGALAEGVLARARAQAEDWLEALLEARPGTRFARATRFGSVSLERARAEARLEARDAIRLPPIAGPRAAGSLAGIELILEGRTRPLLRAGQSAAAGDVLVLVTGRSGGGSEAARLARGRAALDAYVDHAVLAAAGAERVPRRAVLLCADGAYETALPSLGRDAARRWLRAVADDLLGVGPDGTTPRFFPVEAVLLEEEAVRRGDARLADKLGRAVERARTKLEGGSSRFGPIRGASAYDAPEGVELVRMVARRHAAFLGSVRAPVRVGSSAAEGLLR